MALYLSLDLSWLCGWGEGQLKPNGGGDDGEIGSKPGDVASRAGLVEVKDIKVRVHGSQQRFVG